MKRILLSLGLFIFAVGAMTCNAQTIIDAEEESNFNNFYEKTLTPGRKAIPYQFLRENDVVWETAVWRTIDFREKFNQFFYFPTDPEKNTQGRSNLINLLMKAIANGDIEVYEDDDLKVPKDYTALMSGLTQSSTMHIAEYDEWGDEMEGRDTVITSEFEPQEVYKCNIKEFWYIDKQDTRQKVRIVGLTMYYNYCKDRDGERQCDPIKMFCVPMDDMRVRNVLVKTKAYDENNSHAERTYDDIFIDRFFDSYVTRESNRFNREISNYLTGTDAIVESQMIEDKVFDIESDMWEY